MILVVSEFGDKLKKITLEAIGLARSLAQDVCVLAIGNELSPLAEELSSYAKVFVTDGVSHYSNELISEHICEVARKTDARLIFLGDTFFGKDIAPLVATQLDWAFMADCTAIEEKDGLLVTRPIYAGKVITKARVKGNAVCTLRAKVFPEAKKSGSFGEETLGLPQITPKIKVLETKKEEQKRPDLTEADIVVSGGRGFKSRENFQICYELADLFGAAVGSSRAASDSGFIDAEYEVGQTGKIIAPKLYFAIGISGAIQHQVGMKSSGTIVSINKDPDAPIFTISDYGIVDDLFKVVPVLIEELKKRK